jgi:hypothetical protein
MATNWLPAQRVSMTPFGLPVEPEVYMRRASDSGPKVGFPPGLGRPLG